MRFTLRFAAAFGFLLLLVSTMSFADDPKAPEQPSAESAKAAETNPVGYFIGLSMGQQLLGQGMTQEDIQAGALVAGVMDALSEQVPAMTDEQLIATQKQLEELLNKRHTEMLANLKKMNKEKGETWLAQNAKKEGVKMLQDGIQYKVIESGDGASPTASDTVRVHYTGQLINGQVFDSSVQRGEPAEFRVGGVIKGWQTALQKMKVGDKWMLYIPSEMAYGENGSRGAIGPNEVLVFEVELLDII
ncbi:FKBP-type peptidyl-prolyl cis-trans isomerase [Stieleria varia]|nr:FKBP-type peptidyl-prolyl cis-trans isomerase [Stieleria varia]